MAERLTDKTALSTPPADGDLFHVVDISDTTGNAAGTSKKITIETILLRGLSIASPYSSNVYLLARTTGTGTTLVAGDTIVYIDTDPGSEILLIATLKTTVATLPLDLRDDTKAFLWLDTTPLL